MASRSDREGKQLNVFPPSDILNGIRAALLFSPCSSAYWRHKKRSSAQGTLCWSARQWCARDSRALHWNRPKIFNSDQGSQFTSEQFTGVLAQRGAAISMDGRVNGGRANGFRRRRLLCKLRMPSNKGRVSSHRTQSKRLLIQDCKQLGLRGKLVAFEIAMHVPHC